MHPQVTTTNAMTKLSPAAQAVLDAAMASAIQNLHGTYERDIAAALRAAVNQTIQPDPLMGIDCIIYARDILAIATELDPSP
jgi:hypothetical protein